MKVVLDTMIWVSYCTRKGGYRHRLVERARDRRVRLFVSETILEELARTLEEDLGLSRRYAMLARRAVERIARSVELPPVVGRYVPGDPDDDPIFQTALTAKADDLVTADTEILKVGKYQDVEVLNAEQFEQKLDAEPG